MSSTFDLLLRKATASTREAEAWKLDHDEAMRVLELSLLYEEAGVLFRALLMIDSVLSDAEKETAPGREKALCAAELLCLRLVQLCATVPVNAYDYPLSADKLDQMASVLGAMRRGVKLWDPYDSAAAHEALDRGDVLDLDQLRTRLQPSGNPRGTYPRASPGGRRSGEPEA